MRSIRVIRVPKNDGSIIIHLLLVENYEFQRLLLGFGNGIEIIQPQALRKGIKGIKGILEKSLEKYQNS